MSARELVEWEIFEEEFGPLTLHKRLDDLVALLLHQQAIYHGDKGDIDDFRPQWERAGAAHIVDWFSAMAKKT